MGKPLFIAFALIAGLGASALVVGAPPAVPASKEQELKLSDTFSLGWDGAKTRVDVNFAPSFGVFLLQGRAEGRNPRPFFGQVRAQKPPAPATASGIQRYWKQNLKVVAKLGEVSRDQGCTSSKSGLWQCTRVARGAAGNYVADRIVWNRNTDLVYLRVSSTESMEHAAASLETLAWRAR